jgi:hypothetical protein
MPDATPTINVAHINHDLAVSELDHQSWAAASGIPIDRYWSGLEAPPSRHANAKALWSWEAIHFHFTCEQHEPLIVSEQPRLHEKTIGLWDRDVCEVFIAVDPDAPQRYFEFEVAPTGEWVDLAVGHGPGGRDTEYDFQSGMTAAARIEEKKIVLAMRIPWSALGRDPQPGQIYRANLFRCVGTGEDRGYLAWQPTWTPEPNFHVPSVFGYLRLQPSTKGFDPLVPA